MSRADHNLLFGILALQMDFVSQDALVRAMNAWVLTKAQTLGAILQEQGALRAADAALLETLVQRHLQRHSQDARQSLAALPGAHAARQAMAAITDDDVQASLLSVGPPSDTDVEPTGSLYPEPATGERYHLLRPHARGGLGEVLVAEDRLLHREVALKEILEHHAHEPSSRRRFLLEAEVNGRLEHPGIVPVYDLGQRADGRPFYVMRFIQGETLKEALARFHGGAAQRPDRELGERRLRLRQLLSQFVTICNAVAYAHSRGILHRDIKPANILLGKFGETLLVDWGLAKVVGRPDEISADAEAEATLRPATESDMATQVGTALGTPAYMSPEQAAGRLDTLGPTSDVYSLGATLYVILTGRAPVDDTDRGEVLRRVCSGQWQPPRTVKPGTPRALDAICRRAMALNPADRYASAQALAADVEHWLADEPVRAWREPWTVRTGRVVRRHRTAVAALAAAVLAAVLLGGGGLLWMHKDRLDREQEAERALLEVERLRREARSAPTERSHSLLAEALAAAQRADGLLSTGWAGAELRARAQAQVQELQEEERDRRMLVRLDEVRYRQTIGGGQHFDWTIPAAESARAFREYGIDVEALSVEEAAERLRHRPIRAELAAALDYWATFRPREDHAERSKSLLQLARAIDPDPDRNHVRAALAENRKEALVALAGPDKLKSLPLPTLVLLGYTLLFRHEAHEQAERVFKQALERHPGDTVVNWALGMSYSVRKPANLQEALRFYTAALALSSQHRGLQHNVGHVLFRMGRLDEAVASFRRLIDLKPDDADGYYRLADALYKQGRKDEADAVERQARERGTDNAIEYFRLAEYLSGTSRHQDAIARLRRAIELEPDLMVAHRSLGLALQKQGDIEQVIESFRTTVKLAPKQYGRHVELGRALVEVCAYDEAATAYRRAIELKHDYYQAHVALGSCLAALGRLDEAVEAHREACRLSPADYRTHLYLSTPLMLTGQFAEAIAALRRSNDWLRDDKSAAIFTTAQLLADFEQMAQLDGALPAYRRGDIKPGSPDERIALARLCRLPCRRFYAASARFWEEVFNTPPVPAEQRIAIFRKLAAGAAVQAAAGQGEDAMTLTDADRARLRDQALAWLRVDLARQRAELQGTRPEDRRAARTALCGWQQEPELAAVRERAALERLPEAERQAWQAVWVEIATLIRK